MRRVIGEKWITIVLAIIFLVGIIPAVTQTAAAVDPTTIQTIDFETAGIGYTVTGEPTPTTADDWWARTDGTTVAPTDAFSGYQGSYFFYGEDTDTGRTADDPVYVTLSSVRHGAEAPGQRHARGGGGHGPAAAAGIPSDLMA